jgi:hypothetical protein
VTRFAKLLVLAGCAAIVVSTVPAGAATPATGTISKTKKTISWTGSFTVSEPVSALVTEGCIGGATDPICDHFALKVDLGEGARIRVTLPVGLPNDMDIFVFSPKGALVASSGNLPGESEKAEFVHHAEFRKKPYEVQIVPYLVVPGTTYKATATAVTLGAK